MRTISEGDSVRLYHLDRESGPATTLLYGTLAQALSRAGTEAEDVQDGLFIQTSSDVVAYLDLIQG